MPNFLLCPYTRFPIFTPRASSNRSLRETPTFADPVTNSLVKSKSELCAHSTYSSGRRPRTHQRYLDRLSGSHPVRCLLAHMWDQHYSCGPQIIFTLPKVMQVENDGRRGSFVLHVCTCRDRLAAVSCRATSQRALS
jgi:hypothetical protein